MRNVIKFAVNQARKLILSFQLTFVEIIVVHCARSLGHRLVFRVQELSRDPANPVVIRPLSTMVRPPFPVPKFAEISPLLLHYTVLWLLCCDALLTNTCC